MRSFRGHKHRWWAHRSRPPCSMPSIAAIAGGAAKAVFIPQVPSHLILIAVIFKLTPCQSHLFPSSSRIKYFVSESRVLWE